MSLLESVAVKLGMPLQFYCSPALTLLSPNPSSTQSLLQYCTYPSNSFVIPWLPFQPFEWLLSLKMESSLFLLWGAGRRENLWKLILQHLSVVCLCVGEEVGECKIICRCTKQYNGNCIIKILSCKTAWRKEEKQLNCLLNISLYKQDHGNVCCVPWRLAYESLLTISDAL